MMRKKDAIKLKCALPAAFICFSQADFSDSLGSETADLWPVRSLGQLRSRFGKLSFFTMHVTSFSQTVLDNLGLETAELWAVQSHECRLEICSITADLVQRFLTFCT